VLAAGQAPTAREKATLGRDVEDDRKHAMRGMPRGLATFLATIFAHGNNCRTASTGFLHSYDGRPDGLGCDGACMQWPSYWILSVASLSRRSAPGMTITLPRLFRFCGTANAGIKDLIPSYQTSSAASASNSLPCRSCRVPSISTDHSGLFYHHMSVSEHDASAFEPK
jgi:hypothetical protein